MPGTGLANFREQYPQYSDLEDEELGTLVKNKFYADMPDVDYRDAMGLPPPAAPPKERTMWDRVTSIFSAEEEKPAAVMSDAPKLSEEFSTQKYGEIPENTDPPPALLRDQFFAGWDEYRSNRATSAAFSAIDKHKLVEQIARGGHDPQDYSGFGQISKYARNLRAGQGDEDAERQIQEEVERGHQHQAGILQGAIDQRIELMERANTVGYSRATQEMLEAQGFGESMGELADDPMQIMAEISIRSLPNMADAIPLMVAGGLTMGPLGLAVGAGSGASMAEYRASFADYMQQNGIDLTSADAMLGATQDDEFMAAAHDFARTRAGIIGAASTVSGGLATKPLTPFIKQAVARELTNVVAQVGAQGVIEGFGEAGAQLATTGEIRGGEVLAESIGGAITAPIDVATATITGVRSQRIQNEVARIESEVNEMLGLDVPRETPTPAPPPTDQAQEVGLPTAAAEDVGVVESQRLTTARDNLVNVEAEFAALPTDQKANPRNAVNERLVRAQERVAQAEAVETPQLDLFEDAPQYADERLATHLRRAELLEAAADIDDSSVAGRRAQRAVQRAVTGRPLSTGQSRVVRTLLDTLDARDTLDEVAGVLDSRIPDDPRTTGDQREQAERRRTDRRRQVLEMSTEELVSAVYTDPLTGIANSRAFDDDLPNHTWLAEIDVDSLKWVNDNLGEPAGDALLIAVGEALEQSDVDAYRVGGDEFWLGGQSQEEVRQAAELAKSVLQGQVLTEPGKGEVRGINMTYGVGQSREVASGSMKQHKARRESEGKRSPRGVAPKGGTISRVLESTKPIDMAPGTNYVSMIGRHGALPINANHEMVLGNGRAVRIPKKPVRREHILAIMQRAFGVRIYQGKVKGKMRLGFYRPGQGEVRIKNANDIEVAAHEVAHWLDDRYPWISRLYQAHTDEVKSVSYDITKDFEGYAEFMRLFFTQEYEAMHRVPGFYDAFTTELDNHPKLRDTIFDLQELMHAWTQQGARARQASKHGATLPSIYERMARLFRVPFFQSALDGLRRVKQIGMDVAGVDLAYRKLRLAIGGANGVLEAAMYYGTPGWREDGQGLEFTGKSLKQIFGQYWGNEDVALYMMARRARELSDQGRENLLRPDEISAGLRIADEIPEAADMFAEFQEFNQRMLNFAEGSGILGTDTRAAIEEMNQNYVPFHRVIESEIDGRNVKMGGNPFQRLKGGTQNVANIWDNIVNNNGLLIRMALVNDGKRSLLSTLAADGAERLKQGEEGGRFGTSDQNQRAGLYASPITTREAPVKIQSEQVVRKVVEAMGITWDQYLWAQEGMLSDDPDQARLEQGIVESVARMRAGLGEMSQFWQTGLDPTGQVEYYLNDGKKVWFEIADAGLYDSLQYLGPKGTNMVLQIFGGFSAALRRGVVAVPVFQVKNFIRDTTNAWLLSDHVKVPAARALRAVFSRIEKDPAYQEMFLNGGGFANRSQGLQAQRKVIVNPTKLAAVYDRFMGRFENANRLAEFKAAREAGKSPRDAALLSREISTDFAMRGSSEVARFLAISVPFLNARAQGNYRVKRQFDTADRALSYAVRGTGVMLATAALYALNKDDERYEKLPEDIKDLNWIVFTGDGEDDYFLIPKPFESGMLWGTIPERMLEYTEERDGKEFADALGWMFLQTFSMDMVPQVFQPQVDLENNRNFTGAPIIPFYLENVEPSQQFTWYTSETARQAGEAFGISPIKLEHRIRGYLGTMGGYALGASDAMIRAATDDDERAFGEDPTRGDTWKENIMVRALIDPLVGEGPPRRTKYVTDLYDMIREAQLVANTADLMIRRQNDQVEAYLNDPKKQVEFAANEALQEARAALNDVRKQMDLVRMSKDFTGDEKRTQLWELTRTRNELARDAVQSIQREQARIEAELQQQRSQANAR